MGSEHQESVTSMHESITIELNHDEALVLFEYLSRFSDSGKLDFADEAEQIALWKLTGLLEKVMVAPFQQNYGELLQAARNRIRGDESES